MTRPMGQCEVCQHRFQNLKGVRCEAFPDGVPDEISDGEFEHNKHYPGDNGILFKQDPEQPILETL